MHGAKFSSISIEIHFQNIDIGLRFIQAAVCKLLIMSQCLPKHISSVLPIRKILAYVQQIKTARVCNGTFSFKNSWLLLSLQVLSKNEKLKKNDKSI